LLRSHGYSRNVEVRCPARFGRKVYRLAFAHGRRRIAIEFGRPALKKDATLRALGWKVIRL
jgi:hypothetical protein